MSAPADFGDVARRGAALFGFDAAAPQLLKVRENAVFRVTAPDGRAAALRVHRQGYHAPEAVASELAFMGMLHGAGIVTPMPLASLSGGPVVAVPAREDGTGGAFQVDCLTWLEGEPLGRSEEAFPREPAENRRLFAELGATIARMHAATAAWSPPAGFERQAWDYDAFFGPRPLWGEFHVSPLLAPETAAEVAAARERAMRALAGVERSARTFGLIHADLVPENVLVGPRGVAVIDFDDCGFGWYLYDLAVALYATRGTPEGPNLERALLDGYRAVRPLTAADEAALPLFAALRAFGLIGWMSSRADSPHARDEGRQIVASAARIAVAAVK